MAKIKVSDFYYGAVLSMLFNNKCNDYNPALVEGDDDRRVYEIDVNEGKMLLFIKYTRNKQSLKTEGLNSWSFTFTGRDREELIKYIGEKQNLILALVCGVSELVDSEIAFLRKSEIKELLIGLGKNSIRISRKSKERSYRIHRGGGRSNALLIKYNRFDELFIHNKKQEETIA